MKKTLEQRTERFIAKHAELNRKTIHLSFQTVDENGTLGYRDETRLELPKPYLRRFMTPEENQLLLQIAQEQFEVETLEERGPIDLDCHWVAVSKIKKALEHAFKAGVLAGLEERSRQVNAESPAGARPKRPIRNQPKRAIQTPVLRLEDGSAK